MPKPGLLHFPFRGCGVPVLGFHTIGEIAGADPRFLSTKLGSAGLHFHTLAQAEDPRLVVGRRVSKSIGSEHTLAADICKKADIKLHLRRHNWKASKDKRLRRLRCRRKTQDL